MFTRSNLVWHARRLLKASLVAAAAAVLFAVLAVAFDWSFEAIHEDTRQGIGLCVGAAIGLYASYRIDQLRWTDCTLRVIGSLMLAHHGVLYVNHLRAKEAAVGMAGFGHFLSLIILAITAATPVCLILASLIPVAPRAGRAKDRQ